MNGNNKSNSKTPANNIEPTPEADYREAIVRHILWNYLALIFAGFSAAFRLRLWRSLFLYEEGFV